MRDIHHHSWLLVRLVVVLLLCVLVNYHVILTGVFTVLESRAYLINADITELIVINCVFLVILHQVIPLLEHNLMGTGFPSDNHVRLKAIVLLIKDAKTEFVVRVRSLTFYVVRAGGHP